MSPTDITTFCCKKKLCNSCNHKLTDLKTDPLCPNCRRELLIDEFIITNNAIKLYDLRIHKQIIPITPSKIIKTHSIDDNGWQQLVDSYKIPADYDTKLINYVLNTPKIQKALITNKHLSIAKNKKKSNKYILLCKNPLYSKNVYTKINVKHLIDIPFRFISGEVEFMRSLNEPILYYKDTNIPLYPKTKLFIITWFKNYMNTIKSYKYKITHDLTISYILSRYDYYINMSFKKILKNLKSVIRDAQRLQARRIGFQLKRANEIKKKEENRVLRKTTNKITTNDFPPKKKVKLGDIHITPQGDKGILVGFNLWKYISGKILVLQKGKWIVSDRVCTVNEIPERFRNILLKT
jgi:hypothetical protein